MRMVGLAILKYLYWHYSLKSSNSLDIFNICSLGLWLSGQYFPIYPDYNPCTNIIQRRKIVHKTDILTNISVCAIISVNIKAKGHKSFIFILCIMRNKIMHERVQYLLNETKGLSSFNLLSRKFLSLNRLTFNCIIFSLRDFSRLSLRLLIQFISSFSSLDKFSSFSTLSLANFKHRL